MEIDNQENFHSDKDKLIWAKIISIKPYTNENSSTHIVKYYKSNNEKEYYVFNYIIVENNGRNLCSYNQNYYAELAKILKPKDKAYFYGKQINNDEYNLVTMGHFINKAKK